MTKLDHPIAIVRPPDGNYRLSMVEDHQIRKAIFGDDYIDQRDGLHDRVFDGMWSNLHVMRHDMGPRYEIDGWTRPLFDTFLDLVEGGKRLPVDRVWWMLSRLLGDELAAEFMPVLAAAPVVFQCPPEYLSDIDPVGFRRVGPHPKSAKCGTA